MAVYLISILYDFLLQTAAHRAIAIAALTSNSSARVRYRRYQAHMQQATALLHLAHHDDTSASVQEVNA